MGTFVTVTDTFQGEDGLEPIFYFIFSPHWVSTTPFAQAAHKHKLSIGTLHYFGDILISVTFYTAKEKHALVSVDSFYFCIDR